MFLLSQALIHILYNKKLEKKHCVLFQTCIQGTILKAGIYVAWNGTCLDLVLQKIPKITV